MSREILFRGKRKANGEWYYGSYLFLDVAPVDWTGREYGKPKPVHFIADEKDINFAVDLETVGQYTGLTDKNGKKIFEGDIVRADDYVFSIQYGKCGGVPNVNNYGYMGFYLEPLSEKTKHSAYCGLRNDICYFTDINVIGNIYDNPELMEGEKI